MDRKYLFFLPYIVVFIFMLVCMAAFYGSIAYVVTHFVNKFW